MKGLRFFKKRNGVVRFGGFGHALEGGEFFELSALPLCCIEIEIDEVGGRTPLGVFVIFGWKEG